MTAKLTAKQEAFCLAIVAGKSQADAYRAAYNTKAGTKAASVQQAASKLMADPKVASRVDTLRKPAVEAASMTVERHMADLLDLRDKAAEDGKWQAAIAAEVARGKVSGYYVTKVEDVTDPLKKALGNMPADKAQDMLDALEKVRAIQARAKSAA